MSGRYDDIINLPHHVSPTRPRMSSIERAAQFSPFAALTGYDDAVRETARLTDRRIELGEHELDELNAKLREIAENAAALPEVTVTHYVPDERKSGGAYLLFTGRVRRVDAAAQTLIFTDGTVIAMGDILNIEV